MEIIWKKKMIHFRNGTYVCWGLKRKKFWFKNKNELQMNAAMVNYFEDQIDTLEKNISDHKDFEKDIQGVCSIPSKEMWYRRR